MDGNRQAKQETLVLYRVIIFRLCGTGIAIKTMKIRTGTSNSSDRVLPPYPGRA